MPRLLRRRRHRLYRLERLLQRVHLSGWPMSQRGRRRWFSGRRKQRRCRGRWQRWWKCWRRSLCRRVGWWWIGWRQRNHLLGDWPGLRHERQLLQRA